MIRLLIILKKRNFMIYLSQKLIKILNHLQVLLIQLLQ
jgi:hypothetical protein